MKSRLLIIIILIVITIVTIPLIFLGIEYYLSLPVMVGCSEYATDTITNEEYCKKPIMRVT